MSRSFRRVLTFAIGSLTAIAAGPGLASVQASNQQKGLDGINHIVVIYEENHSFDNLYGGWQGVNGRAGASAENTLQKAQDGTTTYTCLLQNDLNLLSPPLPAGCNFANQPFNIATYIPKDAATCPTPGGFFLHGSLPDPVHNLQGGCTEDIVHRFYQEQYQLNGGHQNLYVTGSDAVGLAMGYYDTTQLPIYTYLHSDGHPHYAIADDFFQAAFGGSFLNHQWLIAAGSPTYPGGPAGQHAVLDGNGMTNTYPLYTRTTTAAHDGALTQVCGTTAFAGRACGDFAVNTIQPTSQPTSSNPLKLPLQTGTTIGDKLSDAGVSWAWYSGGWSNAAGIVGGPGWTNTDLTKPGTCADPYSTPNPMYPYCPNKVFQYHHQPFNYYTKYAENGPGRSHLQDEQAFLGLANSSAKECNLNQVSFVKPIGLENEHPGYTSIGPGSNHLVSLLSAIDNSACRKDTMVVVTYDEFGGQWDHVAPPGQGNNNGPHDWWGPGSRIPALIVAPRLRGEFVVDHTVYDTTSILATIEKRYGLTPLRIGSRDGAVNDLSSVFAAHSPFDT